MTVGKCIRRFITLILFIAMIGVILLLLSIAFITPVYHITSNTMSPTIHDGDIVIVYQGPQNKRDNIEYKRGDICLIQDDSKLLVRRIIAEPGDTVYIDKDSGSINVSGELLEELYVNTKETKLGTAEYPITVPEGEYFVLGDDREHAIDSRMQEFGYVKKEDMKGFIIAKIYPLKEITFYDIPNGWENFIKLIK